jgi:hypothetical protein
MTTNANPVPVIALNDGATIPQLGFDVFGFELTPEELRRISALNRGSRIGANPDDF